MGEMADGMCQLPSWTEGPMGTINPSWLSQIS